MRSNLGEDGVRRILAKVEVPVTSREIATYAMCHDSLQEYANPLHGIEKLNKRQVFLLAKDVLRKRGTMAPKEIMQQRWKEKQINDVYNFVKAQFPECDFDA
jgi:hypothetical protein